MKLRAVRLCQSSDIPSETDPLLFFPSLIKKKECTDIQSDLQKNKDLHDLLVSQMRVSSSLATRGVVEK